MSLFGVFLNRKIEIEAKVNQLQRTYLQLLRAPIQNIEFDDTTKANNKAAAQKILKQKLDQLVEVKSQYKQFLATHRELRDLVAEAKEDCNEIEKSLDYLFEELGVENPEPLTEEATESDSSSATLQQEAQELAQQNESIFTNDSEANISTRDEEEDDNSDKENYQSSPQTDSDGYFSPNIQIRKSIKDTDAECFTPAVKSHSKLPIFKSHK